MALYKREFRPEDYGLRKDFKLADYCGVDIWRAIQCDPSLKIEETHLADASQGKPVLEYSGDIFGPILDNPIILGRVAFISALSKFNALGLAVPLSSNAQIQVFEQTSMESREKDVLAYLITRGFEEAANEICIPSSVAPVLPNISLRIKVTISIERDVGERILPGNAKDGDVLVLTKPLGTGVVLSAYELYHKTTEGPKIRSVYSETDMKKAYQLALKTITTTNVKASVLMKKYETRGAVYISKRGILGHAEDWSKLQKDPLFFFIQNLPLIHRTAVLDKALKKKYNLLEGYAPEICGGLLICFEQKQAAKFCTEFNTNDDHAWIVGTVHADTKCAQMSLKRRVIEVDSI